MQCILSSNILLDLLKGKKVILACMGESFSISFHHLANTVNGAIKAQKDQGK